MRQLVEGLKKATESFTEGLRVAAGSAMISRTYSAWRQSPEKAEAYLAAREDDDLLNAAEFGAWLMGTVGRLLSGRIARDRS